MADRCVPRFSAAWRSPSVQLPDISTTRSSTMFILPQQTPRRVLHVRQGRKISASPLPLHKLRPSESLDLFCVVCDVLTNVICERGLRGPRNVSRTLGGRFRCCPPQLRSLLGRHVRKRGEGSRPDGWGRVCGWHREQTFFSPAGILGHRRQGRHDLWHRPHRPLPEGDVLFPFVCCVVSHVPATRVAHPLYMIGGAGLTLGGLGRRGELDAPLRWIFA